MSDPRPQGTRQRPRFFTRRMIAFLILAGLIAALLIIPSVLNTMACRAVEREMASIRAKGEPTTLDELAPPAIPDEENAAVILKSAFAAYDAASDEVWEDRELRQWEDHLRSDELLKTHRPRVEMVLKHYSKAMRLTRQALKKANCRFDIDHSKGSWMELPHLSGIRGLARLFGAEALLHAEAGRAEEAVRGVRDIFRMARTLDNEAILMSQLIKTACLNMGLERLRRVLRQIEPRDAELRSLVTDLHEFDMAMISRRGFMGERVIQADAMDRMIRGETEILRWHEDGKGKELRVSWWSRPYLLYEKLRLLQAMTRVIDATRSAPWKSVSEVEAINSEMERLFKEKRWRTLLSGLLFPAVPSMHGRTVRCWALRDAAVIGLSCELYRSKHGRYPDKLDDLAPEFLDKLPPDPFTGRPFVYRRKGEGDAAGFVVYSVGDNLADDGGVKERSSGKDDIAWEGGHTTGTK